MFDKYQAKLNKWIIEYEVSGEISITFSKMEGKLGYTKLKTGRCEIYINNVIESSDFASTSTLWHEYCHAERWLKYNKSDYHSTEWMMCMARKPLYVIGCVYSQLYYKIHK